MLVVISGDSPLTISWMLDRTDWRGVTMLQVYSPGSSRVMFSMSRDLLGSSEYLEFSVSSLVSSFNQINSVSSSTLSSTLKSQGRDMVSLIFFTTSGTRFSFSFRRPRITCTETSVRTWPYLLLAEQR